MQYELDNATNFIWKGENWVDAFCVVKNDNGTTMK